MSGGGRLGAEGGRLWRAAVQSAGCDVLTGQSVAPPPFPPVQCSPGRVPCEVLGCVEPEQLCDGREDCLDGSDERHCGEQGALRGSPEGSKSCGWR